MQVYPVQKKILSVGVVRPRFYLLKLRVRLIGGEPHRFENNPPNKKSEGRITFTFCFVLLFFLTNEFQLDSLITPEMKKPSPSR